MLPKKGHSLSTWLPTVSQMETRTTRLVGSNGWETHTNTVSIAKSTLSSMKPGFSRGHSPVTGGNEAEDAQRGHAEWNGNTLRFTGDGRQNYWFVPAVVDQVSFCVLVPDMLAIGGYIVSDNYGGCEYHEAINISTMELAVFHVYRGSSGPVKYTLGSGWVLMKKHYSSDLIKHVPTKVDNIGQRDGSVLSISYIPPCRSWKGFAMQSDFICVKGGLVTHTLSQM